MLTCSICGHNGEDVSMYKYIGFQQAVPECNNLTECFAREVLQRQSIANTRDIERLRDCKSLNRP